MLDSGWLVMLMLVLGASLFYAYTKWQLRRWHAHWTNRSAPSSRYLRREKLASGRRKRLRVLARQQLSYIENAERVKLSRSITPREVTRSFPG